MKILFITDNFPPEVNAPASRTYEHCIEWIKNGAEVTVLTCFPNFPQGKIYPGYRNKPFSVETMDGIRVIRLWSYITANTGFAKRIADYVSFAATSALAGLFIRTDVIIATSPQFFTTTSGFFLSKLKRKPWIFELRDIWPDSIKAVGAMKESQLLKILEKLELFLYKNSNLVIALTDAFKSNLINRGIAPEKIEVITNGSNLELFKPSKKNKALLDSLKLQNKFVVGYIGTHGMAHSLDFIIQTISKIKDSYFHFLFIGDGAKKEEIKKLAETLKLKNVTFLNPVGKEVVGDYLSIIDVSLVPLKKCDTFLNVIPSKIFESAAMEKPILLGVEGQSKEIIEKYRAGICFEPENEAELLGALDRLRSDINLYHELVKGCKNLAANYDRKTLAEKMLKLTQSLI